MKIILIFSFIFSLISIPIVFAGYWPCDPGPGTCNTTFSLEPNTFDYAPSVLFNLKVDNTNFTKGIKAISILVSECYGDCIGTLWWNEFSFVNGTNGTTSENSIFISPYSDYVGPLMEPWALGIWMNDSDDASIVEAGAVEYFWINSTVPDEECPCHPYIGFNYSNDTWEWGRMDRISFNISSSTPPPSQCSDGTFYSQCSSNKPLYCDNGSLVERCSQCGCSSVEQICQANESCITPNCSEQLIPIIDLPNGTSVLWGEPILLRGHIIDNCENPLENATVKFVSELPPNNYTRYPEPDNQSSGYYNYTFDTDRNPGWYKLHFIASKSGYPSNSTSKENAFYIALAPSLNSPSVSRTGSCPDKFLFSVRVNDPDLNYNNISLQIWRWEGLTWGEWQTVNWTYRNELTNKYINFDQKFENDTWVLENYSYSFHTVDEFNYSSTIFGGNFTINVCEPCTENWIYGEWGQCIDSVQTRSATDLNNCGTTDNRSALSQSCEIPPEPPSGGLPSPTPQNETVNESTILPEEPANIIIQNENISVKEITIEVKNTVKDVKINVMNFPEKPAQVIHSVIGIVYEYLEFNLTNITDNDIEKATIGFRVSKTWIIENNINKSTVKLNRYFNETWHEIPTLLIGESPGFVYYEAEVPGFSYFAITGEQVLGVTQICVPDTKICAGNVLRQCNAEGTVWLDIAICISGCNNETLSCNPETVEDILWYLVAILLIVIIVILIVYFMRKEHTEKPKTLKK